MTKPIHVKKFDQGRSTPQEYYARHGFPPGARCHACPTAPSVRAIVLVPLDEAQRRNMLPPGSILNPQILKCIVVIKEDPSAVRGKPYVRISITYACRQCRPALEKALAKGPSWAIHELQVGPDPTNRVVGQA
jgi:hypothetical protein